MPVCIGDSDLGLREALAISAGSEVLRAWACGSGEGVLDWEVAGVGSWDRPKSYIPVRELDWLRKCDSIEGVPEESLLERRERGFGLGAGGTIVDLESAEPPVLGWYFVNNSSLC